MQEQERHKNNTNRVAPV